MKMAAPTASKAASMGCNNKPAFPELDFRSGARVEELNKLIQEFTRHDQREYDDQRALEIHTAKDFIFSMLGLAPWWSLGTCDLGLTVITKVGCPHRVC
ncbi:rCG36622, isoform CRA_b [Rattus norvegicus]|uniref:RCG36622, isoform CRA_b n=1 Tax=Rattus norvegicus TaxID=10116 RepID=A6JRX2_RAT|nr:rCG36622, isoform CRA_b [Rattus norvegicus]